MPRGAAYGRAARGVLIALALAVYLWLNVVVPLRALPRYGSDFAHFHRAARSLLAGESPYRVLDYPPLAVLVVTPLAPLPLPAARRVWFLLSEIALLLAAWGTWRAAGGGARAAVLVAAVWCLAGTVQENLVLGQPQPMLLALLAWSLAWWRRRPRAAAALLGIAAAWKLWPGLLLVPFALGRRWRPLAAGAAAAALLVALPLALFALLLPPPWLPATSGFWMGSPAPLNFSLPAEALRLRDLALGRLRPPGPLPASWLAGNNPQVFHIEPAAAALSVAVAAAVLLLGLAALVRRWRRVAGRTGAWTLPAERERLALAALAVLALTASPIAWYHYQLFVLPASVLLAADLTAARLEKPSRRWLALGGLAALTALGTRAHRLVGLYAAAYGTTAARPLLLLAITGCTALVDLALLAWLVRRLGSAKQIVA